MCHQSFLTKRLPSWENPRFFLWHVMPRLIPTRHSGERSKSASAGRCSICTVRSYHKWTWLESGLDAERILLAKCNFSIYIYFYVFVAINHLNASAACACHGPSKALRFLILNSIPSLFLREIWPDSRCHFSPLGGTWTSDYCLLSVIYCPLSSIVRLGFMGFTVFGEGKTFPVPTLLPWTPAEREAIHDVDVTKQENQGVLANVSVAVVIWGENGKNEWAEFGMMFLRHFKTWWEDWYHEQPCRIIWSCLNADIGRRNFIKRLLHWLGACFVMFCDLA